MASEQRIEKIGHFYRKYGMETLLIGRFIPFGVRNGLFLTAGLGKMNFLKFALTDLAACTISTVTYFYLYYHYGKAVIAYIQQSNKIIFALAVLFIAAVFIRKKWFNRVKSEKSNDR
jgi:membrane-associated protein